MKNDKINSSALILFDIDGTLIDAGGAGRRSLDYAFYDLFGIRDALKDIRMAGMTDLRILKDGLKLHGLNGGVTVIDELRSRYLYHLQREIGNPNARVKPGVVELLRRMLPMYPVGLLTGNLNRGAAIKLSALGLSDYFAGGAYGDDNEDRELLLPIAVTRFYEKTGVRAAYKDCVIIGDTPKDVDAAKAHGACALAVATGGYSYGELARAGADAVFENLGDTDTVLEFIRHRIDTGE
ncbi:MAG: haloacid dehalogenase-like hydrolase [Nitrospirae bacterium]|nr:haloacid dehalogenase-like hydrolase [Nitrospirota bacterium]